MSTLSMLPISSGIDETVTPNKGSITAIFKVVDGDTIRIGPPGGQRYRLERLDAPERRTPAGIRATAAMKKLVEGHEVTCSWQKKDLWQRPLVECWRADGRRDGQGRLNIADEMLKVDGVTLWQ